MKILIFEELDNFQKEYNEISKISCNSISCSFPPDIKKIEILGDNFDFSSEVKKEKSREKRELEVLKWFSLLQKEYYNKFLLRQNKIEYFWENKKLVDLENDDVFIYEEDLYSAGGFSFVEGYRRCYKLNSKISVKNEFVFQYIPFRDEVSLRIIASVGD